MRIHRILPLACLAAIVACKSTSGTGQITEEDPQGTRVSDADHRRIAEEMLELAMPGPEHARLMEHVGTWDVKLRSLGPDNQWFEGSGTAVYRSELDGRYLRSDLDAMIGGEVFQGVSLIGFSRLENKYTWIHVDTLSTWPMEATGGASTDGTIHLHGMARDATTPEGRPFRIDNKRLSENERIAELYDTVDGKLIKVMELHEVRRTGGQ